MNVTEITIRKSCVNVKFSAENVSSDEKAERICKLIKEYEKLYEIEGCPSELFIDIENKTQTEYISANFEEIIEYLNQLRMRII